MSLAALYEFYKGYKTAKGAISAVNDSGALKVLSLSSQVDMLVTEYAKLKRLGAFGNSSKAVDSISAKLRAIVNELEKLIQASPQLPGIGNDMTMEYVQNVIDNSNVRQMATNELQRIYMEQFVGALPAAAGGKAYWPDKRRSLLRQKDAALATARSLRGTAFSMQRDIEGVRRVQDGLISARDDKSSPIPRDQLDEMDKDYTEATKAERQLKERQENYYRVSDVFQAKADRYEQLVSAGDDLWAKEKQ